MTEHDTRPAVEHLFAEPVRERLGGFSYGDWRSISAPDAVTLSYGYPYPESFPNEDLVAAAEAVFEEEGDRVLQYGGGEYAERLPSVVAERSRDRGIDCSEAEILLTNGATNALDTVCRTFLDPHDAVFVEVPTFMGTLALFRNFGVDVVPVELDDDGVDVAALEAKLEARRRDGLESPKLFYTIPNFQNPTGATLPLERRERLLELAAEYDFFVLEDDAYGRLRYTGEDVPPIRALDSEGRVAHVGTFSKTIAPGVRTGWIIADEGVTEQLAPMHAGGKNTFTKSVLGRYCTEGPFEENVEEMRRNYAERCERMLSCLDRYMPAATEWTEPEGGFFVWVELPDGIDTEGMLEVAAEEGVVYLPGRMFFPDGGGESGLRISFSHVPLEEMERGIEALGRAAERAIAADR